MHAGHPDLEQTSGSPFGALIFRCFLLGVCAVLVLGTAARGQRAAFPEFVRPSGTALGSVSSNGVTLARSQSGLVPGAMGPSALVGGEIYSTDFESFPVGANQLGGRDGWLVSNNTAGVTGIVDFSPTSPRAAFIGLGSTSGTAVFAWRPVNYDPVAAGTPVIRFSVDLQILDSSNGIRDDFIFFIFNSQGQVLGGIDFFNDNQRVYRYDGTALQDVGAFSRNKPYALSATIDFSSNRWSATLNGASIFTDQPLTVTGRALTLGDIDAAWFIATSGSPGNNRMVFDNYRISVVQPYAPPTFSQQPEDQTVGIGQRATFTTVVSGIPAPTIFWEVGSDGGAGASTVENGTVYSGAFTNALSIVSPTLAMSGARYRCLAYNVIGQIVVSNWVALRVTLPAGVVAVVPGVWHTLMLGGDGALWATGRADFGAPGAGTSLWSNSPVRVADDVIAMAAGFSDMLFLKSDRSLWGAGANNFGQLGDGTLLTRLSPVQVASDVVAIAAGERHSLFVRADGSLWGMGDNSTGQLGDGTRVSRSAPVQIATNVVAVAAGASHSAFIKSDRTLWSMGANAHGQVGDGSGGDQLTPVQVASGVAELAAGTYHTCFLKSNSELWGMGYNQWGTLGDSTLLDRSTPIRIAAGVVAFAAGYQQTLYARADGILWGMGGTGSGELGLGLHPSVEPNPQQITTDVVAFTAGSAESFFIRRDGSLWGMGANSFGQLGYRIYSDQTTPVWITAGPVAIPPPPTGIEATDGTILGKVRLSWNPVLGATRYEIWRSTANSPAGASVIASNVTTALYWDLSAEPATNYYYWIKAANHAGTSGFSAADAGARLLEVAPTFTIQPQNQVGGAGQSAVFRAAATGSPVPSYQWLRQAAGTTGFVALANTGTYNGVTTDTLTVANPASVMNGDQFQCSADNGVGSPAGTGSATLFVEQAPTISSANRTNFAVGLPGRFVITAAAFPAPTFSISGGTLPSWLTLDTTNGVLSGTPPDAGAAPFSFIVSAGNGISPVASQAFTLGVLMTWHLADALPIDGQISQAELLRVIEIYNVRHGTVRTGRYAVASGVSTDGFAVDPATPNITGAALARYHTADTNRDGKISLTELSRVIELYNTRVGAIRTGHYHAQSGTEDGFAPGP